MLVAEDMLSLQLLDRTILGRLGLNVTTVSNGQEAVDLATSHTFDLILMDMQLPLMDGVEATRRLRSMGTQTPIITLTANATEQHRQQCIEAGSDDFLEKPINPASLKKVLAHFLKQPELMAGQATVMDGELDDEIVAIFLNGLREDKDTINVALLRGDWGQVRDSAHRIQGSAASFGFPELSTLAGSLKTDIDHGHMDRVPDKTMELLVMSGKLLP